MENVPVKLAAPPVPEFNYFVDNQVLTAGQLNTVVDYFDRQQRLTRARLVGAGIVCGLEVERNANNTAIILRQGAALTTDGDLMHLNTDRTFTFFRSFTDTKAKYPAWQTSTGSIDMVELLEQAQTDGTAPAPLSSLANLDKMILVLYLESYLRPPEDCTDTDCDNLGPKQMNQLRVLLIHEDQINQNGIPGAGAYEPIPLPVVHRVLISGAAVTGSDNLGNRIEAAMDKSVDSISQALSFTANRYGAFARSGLGNDWSALFKRIATVRDLANGVQFAYSAIKDIADALKELNATVAGLRSACGISPLLFPKHVVAGGLSTGNNRFRHGFLSSAQLGNGNTRMQNLVSQLLRLDGMLRSFELLRTPRLIITPSRHSGPLGERAIPHYYNGDLKQVWSYEKTEQGYAASVRGYSRVVDRTDPNAEGPLAIVHEDCNFYRIEGVQGMEKDSALQQIVNLRNKHNLPFRVESIQIEQDINRVILPPKIKLPFWEGVWHIQREGLFDKLQLAKDYADKIRQGVPTSDTDELVKGRVDSAKQTAATMSQNLDEASRAVYVSAKSFASNYQTFKAPYTNAVSSAYSINKAVNQLSQTPTESPLHHFSVFNNSLQLDRLMDIVGKKTDLVKRQYIFDNFQNQHPGLEHLGGVPVGGTFVVVHQNDRVVADFSLPYAVEFDLDPDMDLTPPVVVQPPIKVLPDFKWVDRFDFFKDIGITKAIEPINIKVVNFGNKLDKEVLTSSNFVTDWLPVLNIRNTNPGLGGLTGGLTTDIKDVNKRGTAESLNKKYELIRYYETKSDLTDIEKSTYNSLIKDYDVEYANTVKTYSDRTNDIEPGSDDAALLTLLSSQYAQIGANSKAELTALNAVKETFKVENKPNVGKNLNIFSFRN